MIAFRRDVYELRFLARRRLQIRLADVEHRARHPFELLRPFAMTQTIYGATRVMLRGSALRDRVKPPAVPFGWTVKRSAGAHQWEVGPIWYLGALHAFYELRHTFYNVMVYKLEWATVPDGGYYHEVKWKWLEWMRGRQSWK